MVSTESESSADESDLGMPDIEALNIDPYRYNIFFRAKWTGLGSSGFFFEGDFVVVLCCVCVGVVTLAYNLVREIALIIINWVGLNPFLCL